MEEDKEYFRIYYQNHKGEYRKRDKKWRKNHPGEVKAIRKRYRENHPMKKRIKNILGPPIKKIKLKPFKERISPELQAKMKENTRINNKYIKFFNTVETGNDKFLVQNILKKSEAVANE